MAAGLSEGDLKHTQVNVNISSLNSPSGDLQSPSAHDHNEKNNNKTTSNARSISDVVRRWTPTALLLSYFVFSISLYTVLNDEATKVFWFLYLTIATLVAGTTALEAYDGLTPLREARKATVKFEKSDNKFKITEDALPPLELVFDLNYDEFNGPCDFDFLRPLRDRLLYPNRLVRVNVLCRENSTAHVLAHASREQMEMAGVRICAIPIYASTSLSARMAYFLASAWSPDNAIIAIFSAGQRPHPHSVRHAVEMLAQDASADVVQGRTIAVPRTAPTSFFAAAATLEHDMVYALLRPGRSSTWGLGVANDTNTYWKLDALRAATSMTGSLVEDGQDLGFTAASQGAKAVYDLRVAAYEPCAKSLEHYLRCRTELCRCTATATLRYTGLAFRKHTASEGKSGKWTLKRRLGVLYALPILQVVSHAVLQYLCLSLAILFTDTPKSTLDFASTIYYPYPISEWLLIGGVVCLLTTVIMIYKARSEFVPLWTAPIVLVLYPVLLVWRSCIDVYAQFEVLVR